MAKRNVAGREIGFYRNENEVEKEEMFLEVEGDLEDGVYKVERVVERRVRKVRHIGTANMHESAR